MMPLSTLQSSDRVRPRILGNKGRSRSICCALSQKYRLSLHAHDQHDSLNPLAYKRNLQGWSLTETRSDAGVREWLLIAITLAACLSPDCTRPTMMLVLALDAAECETRSYMRTTLYRTVKLIGGEA